MARTSRSHALTEIVIVGAGGVGREVYDVVARAHVEGTGAVVKGYVDDGPPDDSVSAGLPSPLLGDVAVLGRLGLPFVIAIGCGSARRRIADDVVPSSCRPMCLVDTSATVGRNSEIGAGSIVFPGARISTSVTLGRHVQVHANATVGHDVVMEDFATVLPGATVGGRARIGIGATIGSGATVLPDISIGAMAMVGAGAVAVRDVAEASTVVGVPATPLSSTS